jgi:hypothetical protein
MLAVGGLILGVIGVMTDQRRTLAIIGMVVNLAAVLGAIAIYGKFGFI